MTTKYPPVIVMGSPSSGTTLTSKILTQMGIFLGYNLNNKFESWFFVTCNEYMFSKSGARWDNPNLGSGNYPIQPVEDHVKNSVMAGIDIPWGWKDPGRNDYTAHAWKEIFPDATFLRVIRHPMDVALSLNRREKKKPLEYLNAPKPEPDLDGIMRAWPAKSKRCCNLEGALNLSLEYYQHEPQVEYETIYYERLLQSPRAELSSVDEGLWSNGHRELFTHKDDDFLSDLIDPSRAFAFRETEQLVEFFDDHKPDDFDYEVDYD